MRGRSKVAIHRLRGNDQGFTLVEVLVAAALFVGVFVTLATLFVQATTNLSGARLISATLLAQAVMQEAVGSDAPETGRWTVRSNRILWEVERTVEQAKDDVLRVGVIVRRVSDRKIHASLWTEIYRPSKK